MPPERASGEMERKGTAVVVILIGVVCAREGADSTWKAAVRSKTAGVRVKREPVKLQAWTRRFFICALF
jgi:hypothetical protein